MSNLESLRNLDDKSKKEMAEWIESEGNKARIRAQIHQFTDLCFSKCVRSASSSSLSSSEQNCLSNCVNRYLDTNESIISLIQQNQH